jgi:tRNA-specific 2-thiouridylase
VRVLVAMSGGVDSSVAAARLIAEGHEVVGATLKLWGGPQSTGCCSVADVDDARRVAQQLGIPHHVFNLTEDFQRDVVGPYVAAHAEGRTPNPCIECNRHIKFDRLLERARRLGFDRLATGHHAQVAERGGRIALLRGADLAKDQSYVLSMLGQSQLGAIVLPVGTMTKMQVRAEAVRLGLRTAAKPDSQDVCFVHDGEGRGGFLSSRLELHRGEVIDDASGTLLGTVDAVELVTVGQRRGMPAAGRRLYAVAVDVRARRVRVADAACAAVDEVSLVPGTVTWVDRPLADGDEAVAQTSAHGRPARCVVRVGRRSGSDGDVGGGIDEDLPAVTCRFHTPQRPVAPGQTLAFYDAADPDAVRGAGIVAGCRRLG